MDRSKAEKKRVITRGAAERGTVRKRKKIELHEHRTGQKPPSFA